MSRGNPENVSSLKWFDSMKQASAALGLDMALLKRAKAAGCPHFAGSRVSDEVKKWVAEHEAEMTMPGSDNLKEQKLTEEVRKLRIRNDREEGKLVKKADVAASILRIMSRAAPYLEAKLVNEYPSACAGLDVPQTRVYGRRLFDDVMVFFQSLAKEFPI